MLIFFAVGLLLPFLSGLFLALNGNTGSKSSGVSQIKRFTGRESLEVKCFSTKLHVPFSTKLHVTFCSHRQHLLSGLSKSTFSAAKIIFL